MQDRIARAAGMLLEARHVAALTGAGISVESGIPPFRGKGGLWEKIDPIKYASIEAFMADPADVWQVLIKGMHTVLEKAEPNKAHKGLARLEELGILKTIITQNVDGLHQMAGSRDVIEFHGTFANQRCLDCDERLPSRELKLDQMPPRCACGGIYRPDVVFFGEQIPFAALKRSEQIAVDCDVMLVIGSSATVQPAAFMPMIAKQNGAAVIEINAEATDLTHRLSDISILEKAGAVMEAIVTEVERQL